MFKKYIFVFLIILCSISLSAHATPIPFTVNLSEAVNVTGNPRLQLDIGGVTRYAPYASGSGTNALTFAYPVVAPDFDRNGITLVSPLDLNGGTIRDLNGNNANLAFTAPNSSGVLVQSYTVAWTTSPINATNETAAAFNILNAPTTGATYNYTITSSGGGGSVTGSGSITANPQSVTGVNVSSLPAGTLTLSVTVTNATGTGNPKTNTVSGAFTGVLDGLPASAAAYSVRRLSSTYTGSLIRVRRSSDNAEQDIGSTLGGNLNTTALTTFCGANSCFVRTWYDQSGNARDAIQTTNANQPIIVNAGVYLAGLRLDGVNDYLDWVTIISPNTANFVASITSSGFVCILTTQLETFPYSIRANGLRWSAAGNSQNVDDWGFGGTSFINGSSGAYLSTSGTKDVVTVIQTGGKNLRYIGASEFGTSRYFNGSIQEIVTFGATLNNTDRQTLENNQKAYYSIP
jgi:hypothetical protein